MTLPRALAMPLPPSHPARLEAFHEALKAVCAEWGYSCQSTEYLDVTRADNTPTFPTEFNIHY